MKMSRVSGDFFQLATRLSDWLVTGLLRCSADWLYVCRPVCYTDPIGVTPPHQTPIQTDTI